MGSRKKLSVELQLAIGGSKRLEAWENEPLQLEAERMQPAVCEVLDEKSLLAWQPGDYEITRSDVRISTLTATLPKQITLEKSWKLTFPPGWGASTPVTLDHLASWTEPNTPEEARAFSGPWPRGSHRQRPPQRQAPANPLVCTLQTRRHIRPQARNQPTRGRSHQHLAQPLGLRFHPSRATAQNMDNQRPRPGPADTRRPPRPGDTEGRPNPAAARWFMTWDAS